MNLQTLKIFQRVYRKANFAEVAKDLNVAPSSITRHINSLEKELGVKLFTRTTRKVTPTEKGKTYFARIEPLIEDIEAAQNEIIDQGHTPKGTIRITCPVSFNHIFLTPLLPKFLKEFPEINVEAIVTDSKVDLISERIDLAIRFGKLEDSSSIATKLSDLEYIVCSTPSYLKKNPKLKRPKDVINHNCLSFLFPKFNLSWKFEKSNEIQEVSIKSKVSMTSALSLIELTKKGEGISLLPKALIHKELSSGKLINLFPKYNVTATEFGSAIYLVYPSKSYLPLKTRLFIDYLKNELRYLMN